MRAGFACAYSLNPQIGDRHEDPYNSLPPLAQTLNLDLSPSRLSALHFNRPAYLRQRCELRPSTLAQVPPSQQKATPKQSTNREPSAVGRYGVKWIDIDLSAQRVIAYEGKTPVYNVRVSTGTRKYPTVQGTFRVYVKLRSTRMRGGTGSEPLRPAQRPPHHVLPPGLRPPRSLLAQQLWPSHEPRLRQPTPARRRMALQLDPRRYQSSRPSVACGRRDWGIGNRV